MWTPHHPGPVVGAAHYTAVLLLIVATLWLLTGRSAARPTYAPLPPPTTVPSAGRVRVVTLNTCLWPRGLRASLMSSRKEERLRLITAFAARYDVVLMQELLEWAWASGHSSRQHVAGALAGHLFAGGTVPAEMGGRRLMGRSQATLCRAEYEVRAHQWRPFQYRTRVLFTSFVPCGFEETVLLIEGHAVHLLNVHLLPPEGAVLDARPSHETNASELRQLERRILQIADAGEHWVVGGDFNVDSLCERGRGMLAAFAGRVAAATKRPVHASPAAGEGSLNIGVPYSTDAETMRVDHFFSSLPVCSARVRTDVNVSDHFPVEIELQLPATS